MSKLKNFISQKESMVGITILCLLAIIAIFAPLIAPGNPLFSVGGSLIAPGDDFIMGTDNMGRSVLAMIVWGSRVSMLFAFGAAGISLILGVVIGALSGYIGGIVDDIISRIIEVFYIIPRTFLIILMVAIFGSSIPLMIAIVGITTWPSNAKIMRAQVLILKNRGYVRAARVAGGRSLPILFKHVVPNGIGPVLANSTLQMAQAILTEASLSFLGLGDPNQASWGQILQSGQRHISSAPWLVIIPGATIAIMLLSFNLLSNSLQKTLNVQLLETE